jgi:hypothetical protein
MTAIIETIAAAFARVFVIEPLPRSAEDEAPIFVDVFHPGF